jgi:predicted RNA-binding Zn-ribbon protein involved in translation (DUF1610 family)
MPRKTPENITTTVEVTMPNVDANVISFQCPKCGNDLQQTIGLMKSNQRLVCNSCGVGISFDTAKLAKATEILKRSRSSFFASLHLAFDRRGQSR